jgi:hypothetical protein
MGVGFEGGLAGGEEAGMGFAWWRDIALLPASTIAGCRTPQAPSVRQARLCACAAFFFFPLERVPE